MEWTAEVQMQEEVKIQSGIFQWDLIIVICYWNDATALYTNGMLRRLQIYKITRTNNPFPVYGWNKDIRMVFVIFLKSVDCVKTEMKRLIIIIECSKSSQKKLSQKEDKARYDRLEKVLH